MLCIVISVYLQITHEQISPYVSKQTFTPMPSSTPV